MKTTSAVKQLLYNFPFSAELYWLLRNRDQKAFSRFNLDLLQSKLPQMSAEVEPFARSATPGKKVFLFASLHFWITHTMLTGLALRGLGHEVTLGYLPFSDFTKPITRFDLRRHDLYARKILGEARSLVTSVPMLGVEPAAELPEALTRAVGQITVFDARYILQREDVSGDEPIARLRSERNLDAARRAYAYFQKNRPEVVIVPNGMIQEFGAVYETARFMGIPVVTYEFGEQDQRIWLGQDAWVIHHHMDGLWAEKKERKLDEDQRSWLASFLAGRQKLAGGPRFAHLWQKADQAGGRKMRADLGLDERPVVLLPTNVLGDSATLGLDVFSGSMTGWMGKVLPFLAARPEVQVVIRIHPGETLTVGPSVTEIVGRVLPQLPGNIHLIGPTEKVNTYDLMEIADLALVYTTTAGLEMATRGIPVLLSGRAHYRGKGFTLDPDTWEQYFSMLDLALSNPARLTEDQVERAWNYAYCFFNEYPRPFPWHIEKMNPSLKKTPLAYVLGPEGRAEYESTFDQMVKVGKQEGLILVKQ